MSFIDALSATFKIVGASTNKNGLVTITGFPYDSFKRFLKKNYNVGGFMDRLTVRSWSKAIMMHEWFVPEMIYLLDQAAGTRYINRSRANALIEALYQNTWFETSRHEVKSIVDLSQLNQCNYQPLDYQLEFLQNIYYQKKIKYQLKGYLLSFQQGLGKSKVSLFLFKCLHKKYLIIICPLSTISNVWKPEVEDTFKRPHKIWTPKDSVSEINVTTDVVIVNYESIDKITNVCRKYFKPDDTMIVIDESHSLKDLGALRTKNALFLADLMQCQDILLMSGTPIKALGVEALPIFKFLDPYFRPEVQEQMKYLLRYPSVMNELLRNRLGLMMHRVLKEDVLNLPPKHEEELKIKIPKGDKYTFDSVINLIEKYRAERERFYEKNFKMYDEWYEECLDIFEKTISTPQGQQEFQMYKFKVKAIQARKISSGLQISSDLSILIQEVNKYEKEVIIPRLPSQMKQKFRDAKSVVKYVGLKIMGEIIGNLLTQLRMEMTSGLIGKEVMEIIAKAEKKTILFSSYTDTIAIAEQRCKEAGYTPLIITGENSTQAKQLLEEFKTNPKLNPLIASIQVLSTGHTIISANTVIFLNRPWRSVDYEQASDRVYRIGQDTDVYIYTLTLDTGEEPNLSTRMADILQWSKTSFQQLVGDDPEVQDTVNHLVTKALVGTADFTEQYEQLLQYCQEKWLVQ